jgi:hypothetical protein
LIFCASGSSWRESKTQSAVWTLGCPSRAARGTGGKREKAVIGDQLWLNTRRLLCYLKVGFSRLRTRTKVQLFRTL